jgi:serine/threonine protein kinase/tetratricopeptide (TPR) repeat protein
MNQPSLPEPVSLPPLADTLDVICDRFEAAWLAALAGAKRPRIEDYLCEMAVPRQDLLLRELVGLDACYRNQAGEQPRPEEYQALSPELSQRWLARHIQGQCAPPPGTPTPAQEGPLQEAERPARTVVMAVTHMASATVSPAVSVAVPGYEVLGVLGRGGMGIVYKARHLRLDRIVALKKVRYTEDSSAEVRERFEAEARAVARLQHAHIVQVFEVGEHDGAPYMALELCTGGSLASKLNGTPWEAASAARVVQTLAVAIHVAHRSGVVHRDLKPGNILLQRHPGELPAAEATFRISDFEPKVTDFGLAKRLDDPSGRTPSGAVLGTPSYMAPEQAEGGKQVGPAADVYALGAVLYELLVGRPPFKAASVMETLHQVMHEEPVSPARLRPQVPRDLETICLKCLEKAPERRYTSAADLADDLRRFLAGEPIRARPVGMAERLWRWGRRNPTVATLAAITVVTLLSGTAVASYFAVQARARLGQVEAERDRAQTNLQLARQAVDDYSLKVSNDPRLREKFLSLRKELLQTVVPFYEKLLTQAEQGPEVQAELGRTCSNLGWIMSEIGEKDKAIARYQQARAMLTPLSSEHPEERSYRASLSEADHRLGMAYLATGKSEDAKAALEQALAARKQLAAECPHDRQYQTDLVASYFELANVARATGKAEEAEAAYQEVLSIRKRLAEEHPEDPSCQQAVGATYNNLGTAYRDRNKLAEATKAYEEALKVRQRLAKEHPESAAYLADVAASQGNVGIIYSETGRKAEAERAFLEAVALQKRLTEQHPETPRYRNLLARNYDCLGNLYKAMGKKVEAAKSHAEAQAQFEQLAAEHPEVQDYVVDLAGCYCNLGHLAGDEQDLSGALKWYSRAIPILEAALRKEPNDVEARECLSIVHEARGKVLSKLGKHDEGLRDCDRSLELDNGRARLAIRVSRAQVLARSGQHARADAEATELAKEGSLSGEDRYRVAVVWALACASARKDDRLSAARRQQQAEEYATRAMDLLVKLAKERVFADPSSVESVNQEADLDSLRDRVDFKKWLAGLRK